MSRARQTGFTLVELIMTMILVGILAVTALPRLLDKSIFESRGFHDEVMAALRFAQKSAIAQRRTVCVAFTANSVTLTIASAANSNTCNTNLQGPTGAAPFVVTGRAGISFTATPTNFLFNSLGQPINAAGQVLATQSIQVSGAASAITIETETGYVHQ